MNKSLLKDTLLRIEMANLASEYQSKNISYAELQKQLDACVQKTDFTYRGDLAKYKNFLLCDL